MELGWGPRWTDGTPPRPRSRETALNPQSNRRSPNPNVWACVACALWGLCHLPTRPNAKKRIHTCKAYNYKEQTREPTRRGSKESIMNEKENQAVTLLLIFTRKRKPKSRALGRWHGVHAKAREHTVTAFESRMPVCTSNHMQSTRYTTSTHRFRALTATTKVWGAARGRAPHTRHDSMHETVAAITITTHAGDRRY